MKRYFFIATNLKVYRLKKQQVKGKIQTFEAQCIRKKVGLSKLPDIRSDVNNRRGLQNVVLAFCSITDIIILALNHIYTNRQAKTAW